MDSSGESSVCSNEDCNCRLEAVRKALDTCTFKLKTATAENQVLTVERAMLERKLARLHDQHPYAMTQSVQVAGGMGTLSLAPASKLGHFEQRIGVLTGELDSWREKANALVMQNESLSGQLNNLQRFHVGQEKEMQQYRVQVQKLEQELSHCQERRRAAEQDVGNIQERADREAARANALALEIEANTSALLTSEQAAAAAGSKSQQLELKLAALQTKHTAAPAELEAPNRACFCSNSRSEGTQTQLHALYSEASPSLLDRLYSEASPSLLDRLQVSLDREVQLTKQLSTANETISSHTERIKLLEQLVLDLERERAHNETLAENKDAEDALDELRNSVAGHISECISRYEVAEERVRWLELELAVHQRDRDKDAAGSIRQELQRELLCIENRAATEELARSRLRADELAGENASHEREIQHLLMDNRQLQAENKMLREQASDYIVQVATLKSGQALG